MRKKSLLILSLFLLFVGAWILTMPGQAADERFTLAYRFTQGRVLTYHETTVLRVSMGGQSVTTLDLDRTYSLTATAVEGDKATLSKKIIDTRHRGTQMGKPTEANFVDLPKVGTEVSFVTNSRGFVLSKYQPLCTMIIEGFPANPISVGSSWDTKECDGTVRSTYTLTKIIKKNENTTYYLIKGKHQRYVYDKEKDPKSGILVSIATETTGSSWTYYVPEWGQVVSCEYTEDGKQTLTQSESAQETVLTVDVHQENKLQLTKIGKVQ